MFTIKHIHEHREALVQGSEVNHVSATTVMYRDGNDWQSLVGGVVYVMNDAGKTVAHYTLEDDGSGSRPLRTPRERITAGQRELNSMMSASLDYIARQGPKDSFDAALRNGQASDD